MNLINYLKKNGIKRAVDVFFQYKLEKIIVNFLMVFLRKKPLLDAIVIESHNDFDCNGGAFYDYLLRNGYNKRYKIVWLLRNKAPRELPENVVALPLQKPSLRKCYYICRAKYFTADNQITRKARPDQLCFFFDHGAVSLKSVRGLYAIPESVDYMLSPSENYDPVIASEYSLTHPDHRFVHPGYPCHDVLYREIPDELEKVTTKKFSKVYLWMPTFRKGGGYCRNDSTAEFPYGIPLVENEQMMNELQKFLEENNSLLVIKVHPMQDPDTLTLLHGSDNILVLTGQTVKELGVDNYRLIKSADALISDYSSIAYSYLLLNRPMAFVLSDLKDYKLGFAMPDPERYLVGEKIYTFDQFFAFLKDVRDGNDTFKAEREALGKWLFEQHDGNSCQRIAEMMGLQK